MKQFLSQTRFCIFGISVFLFIFALPVSGAKRDTKEDKKARAFARSVGIQSPRAWKVYVAAKEGDVESQYRLAIRYYKGDGVKQNRRRAAEWYHRAAEQGHLEARYNLANMYSTGTGVTQNLPEAFKWYKRAAEQGHLEAQYNLANMYSEGRGVTQNLPEAFKWYKRAAEREHLEAQYNLANMYSEGRGVAQNLPEAFKWYGKAAGKGHQESQRILESHEEFAKYRIQLDSILPRHINSLQISDHNKSLFQSKKIHFIGNLVEKTETELLKILDFSMPNLANVKATLALLYLELEMDIWFLYFERKKKEWNPVLALPVESLELSTHTKNALKDEGIHYVGDLVRRTERQLKLYTLNLKQIHLEEVKTALIPLGLELGMNIYWPFHRAQEKKLVQYLNVKGLTSIQTIDPILAHPIENLGLSVWSESALKVVGVRYLGALVTRTEKDLLKNTSLGVEGVSEINIVLASLGLELGMSVDYWPSDPEEEEKLVKRLGNIVNQNLLIEREVQIVKMRFGIGEIRRTFKEIGQIFNLSGQRIRQIQVNTLRRLHYFGKLTGRIKDVDYFSDLTSEQVELLLRLWNPRGFVKHNRPSAGTKKTKGQQILQEDLASVLARRVDNLELSTRSRNALQAEDIYYLDELVEKTKLELSKIPNLGKKSLTEIETVLATMDLELGQQLDAETEYTLAVRYYEGDRVERNPSKAFSLYKKAAWKGHIEAQYSVAYMYSAGEGTEADLQQAERFWKEAAKKGHLESQRSLDEMCPSVWE